MVDRLAELSGIDVADQDRRDLISRATVVFVKRENQDAVVLFVPLQ